MLEKKVILEEQGLRDGIQNLDIVIPTEQKLNFIYRLVKSGITRIQVASFVHPQLVPQMSDAEDLIQKLDQKDGIVYSGLVLNLKGVERALKTDIRHLSCSISASDTHSKKNTRMSLQEARINFSKMVTLAKSNDIIVRGGIQCAFGCRYEGKIDPAHILEMTDRHLEAGVEELALADSTGMANPKALHALMLKVLEKAKEVPVILHLHNTEGKGMANVYAALEAGVRMFDTAFGGLGGCPFIKSASGNIATEDTIHMLHQMGYETEIDINKVAEVSREMEAMLGQKLQGRMYDLLNKDIKIT